MTKSLTIFPLRNRTDAPLYTWDFENSTALLGNGTPEASSSSADDPLTLSLFAKGYRRAIKTYRVAENVANLSFVFPCGLVVQGGIHFFRLARGDAVLAESGEVDVAWPRVVMQVPRRLETYHSPVDVEFGFTRNICLPQSPVHFKVWVDLLYHGVPVAGPDLNPQPTTATPPGSGRRGKHRGGWTPLDDDRLRRALRKARNRTSAHDRKEGKSRRKFTWRMKKQRRRKNRLAGVARPDARQGETQDRDGGEEGEAEEALARVKRMMGAQPPRGTLVSSGARAGSSAWGGRAMRLERILLPALYARGSHRVSFLCDSIGPAGLYSVRLITNVSSSPVIASSEWFTVVWSDLFNLFIRASSITPCKVALGVTVSHPACIGEFDKVRVFARVRANVTSADPPTVDRYLLERRVIPFKSSVVFPCSVFELEATDFCFVYVNTAKNKAVSEVQRKCIPTYRPNGIIITIFIVVYRLRLGISPGPNQHPGQSTLGVQQKPGDRARLAPPPVALGSPRDPRPPPLALGSPVAHGSPPDSAPPVTLASLRDSPPPPVALGFPVAHGSSVTRPLVALGSLRDSPPRGSRLPT
ncbi:hypothetical protein C7M84_010800 [Penaeus vannamei]|uniref:Uncharacterized protein n=1 Tax=Penaeus vannamei TaxID=6689 RepID=A0A3R7M9Q2_PENVA|nr:hypothetical protein C7M84_010800 [Penaeus vannamei]